MRQPGTFLLFILTVSIVESLISRNGIIRPMTIVPLQYKFVKSINNLNYKRSSLSLNVAKSNIIDSKLSPESSSFRGLFTKVISAITALSRLVIKPTISAGLLAGSLHAVTGPDHLAAIFPSAIGKHGYEAFKLGASWGLGHGLSASCIGVAGFLLKDQMSSKLHIFEKLSVFTDSAVGISLLLIGIVGVIENLKEDETDLSDGSELPDGSEVVTSSINKSTQALFVNGFLHGFSWDGAPSLAPALAMNTWRSVLTFLFSYCVGTTLSMSATAAIVGESTVRLGKVVEGKNFTRNLSIGSSVIAIVVGIYWLWKSIF